MGETQEVEGFGLSPPLFFCPLLRHRPKRQNPGLLRRDLQLVQAKPLLHLDAESLGVRFVFEAGHIIIRIPDQPRRPRTAWLESPLKPEVQRVVEVEIRQ